MAATIGAPRGAANLCPDDSLVSKQYATALEDSDLEQRGYWLPFHQDDWLDRWMSGYDNYDLLEFFPRRYQKVRKLLTTEAQEITSLRRQTQLLAMQQKILRELHWEKEQMKTYIRPTYGSGAPRGAASSMNDLESM